jgi:hypothetical protein
MKDERPWKSSMTREETSDVKAETTREHPPHGHANKEANVRHNKLA